MVDPNHEMLLTLQQVACKFPGRSGRGVSLSCVWRWVTRGRRGHRLETILVGGRRYSSEEAVMRFIRALNPEQPSRQGDVASDQDDAIEKELEANGF